MVGRAGEGAVDTAGGGVMPPDPTTRTAVIAFHITEAEKVAIEHAAAGRRVSVAALMREAVELRRPSTSA
jgi:hypothetical protein